MVVEMTHDAREEMIERADARLVNFMLTSEKLGLVSVSNSNFQLFMLGFF